MAESLDPTGAPVFVGNLTLSTPGLVGVAESHPPGTPGMRAAESSTPELDAALEGEGMQPQETVEISETQEIDTGAGMTRGETDQDWVTVTVPHPGEDWGQVLLAVDETGVMTWNFAEELNAPPALRGSTVRTYRLRRYVPPSQPETGENRGLIGAVGTKLLKVLAFKLLDEIGARVSDHFVGQWELKKRPYRVRSFTAEDYASPEVASLDSDAWRRLEGGRALLFVHGTFSRANTAFGTLPPEFVAELHHHYDGRVFAFDHFTLSHDPMQNINVLVDHIPDGTRLDLDVVCHSRGGLVARTLAEKQSEISLSSRRVSIRKVVFVASPNAGTILADADHFGALIDTYTNLLNFVPDTGVVEVLQTVIAVVKQLAVGAVHGLDGLGSMVPNGVFLSTLNIPCEAPCQYFAVASDYDAAMGEFKDWATDRIMDAMFSRAENDLVVPTLGVYETNGSSLFPISEPEVLRGPVSVVHSRYFSSRHAQEKLRAWLA